MRILKKEYDKSSIPSIFDRNSRKNISDLKLKVMPIGAVRSQSTVRFSIGKSFLQSNKASKVHTKEHSIHDLITKLLHKSESPAKPHNPEEEILKIPKELLRLSPNKSQSPQKHLRNLSVKSHFRSISPLKAFHDRIFKLKKVLRK